MGSSKFSSPFFQKSPLLGAYRSGADAVFAVSDAEHFSKLQNDITAGTLATFTPDAMDADAEKRISKREGRISSENVLGVDVEKYTPSKFSQLFGKEATTNTDKVNKYKEKTAKLQKKLDNRKSKRTASTQEKLTSNCIDKKGGYIGYDPDLNNGKGGCYK